VIRTNTRVTDDKDNITDDIEFNRVKFKKEEMIEDL